MHFKNQTFFTASFSLGVALAAMVTDAAHAADSSVTMSGYLDVGVYRDYDKQNKVGNIGRSNLAFSGVEKLDGDLSATFRLSTRFNMDDGTQESRAFWHDESTVGLKGNWGELKMGRALTAMWNNDWKFDPWYNFDRIASPAWNLWHGASPSDVNSYTGGPVGTIGPGAEYARLNGGIFYQSPAFSGFSVNVSQGVSQNPEDLARNTSAVLLYSGDAWSGMLSAERNTMKNLDLFAAGKYTINAMSFMAAYDYEKPDVGPLNRSLTASSAMTFNQTTVSLGYGRQIDYKANFFGLGVRQALSKRTNVFVSLGHKCAGFWGAANSATAYGVAVSHSF